MPVLLAVLKGAAILVALVLILLVVALLLPLGFAVEYRPGHLRIAALYGPLQRTVWSHRLRWPSFFTQPKQEPHPQPAAPAVTTPPEPKAQPENQPTAPPEKTEPQGQEAPVRPEGAAPGGTTAEEAPTPAPELEEEMESGAIMSRLERMLEVTAEDPKAMANCVLGHMRWLQKHSFFKIHIRHLHVFWTVTCEDASRTAVVYGAEMAAFNTALALVQQTVLLQSDRLWLEPDFTGERRKERRISFTVSASAVLMFHLLYRIWKDPLLKPQSAPQPEPQTT